MHKFESSQKDESRAQSADSSKVYRKPGTVKLQMCIKPQMCMKLRLRLKCFVPA